MRPDHGSHFSVELLFGSGSSTIPLLGISSSRDHGSICVLTPQITFSLSVFFSADVPEVPDMLALNYLSNWGGSDFGHLFIIYPVVSIIHFSLFSFLLGRK